MSRRAVTGARLRLALSVLIECALSALLAPVRMLFHTQFVVASLLGRAVRWRSPKRADAHTDWAQAFRRHGFHTMVGVAWIALVWWLDPPLPAVVAAGRRRIDPFDSAVRVHESRGCREGSAPSGSVSHSGGNAHSAGTDRDPEVPSRGRRPTGVSHASGEVSRLARRALLERALHHGIGTLTADERDFLIAEPEALTRLDGTVSTDSEAHPSWSAARDERRAGSDRIIVLPEWFDGTEKRGALRSERSAIECASSGCYDRRIKKPQGRPIRRPGIGTLQIVR